MRGRIVRGIGGFYYVKTDETREIYECRARGIFRKNLKKPLVGDVVDREITDAGDMEGSIVNIYDRRNFLIRPAAANVDQAMVIFALASPEPLPGLLDRFLIRERYEGIPVIICMNKTDLAGEEKRRLFSEIYSISGSELLFISAKTLEGEDELRGCLKGKVTVLSGPSGVGKSTIINMLTNSRRRQTGEVSRKLKRGKQTSTDAELIELNEDTFIIDTPGFSSLDIPDIDALDLQDYYPEIAARRGGCFFSGCSHTHEPKCAVRSALESKEISMERYASYSNIYEELSNRRKY
ncbi:MAG: ribosome small subunit-dependent GTPase A [Lachnospiraceae bacterium]|nr:ribosome small subunit-dependent GTPase A [Lachnospiraceae bacterium]